MTQFSNTNLNLPNNVNAEKAILGIFLNNNEKINEVSDLILPEHFFLPLHQKIYEKILRVVDKGLVATPLTIKMGINLKQGKNAENNEKDEEKELFEYLVEIVQQADIFADVKSLASVIHEDFLRRELIRIGQDMVLDAGQNRDHDAIVCLEQVEKKLFSLASDRSSNAVAIREALLDSLHKIEAIRKNNKKVSGVSTGFIEMDRMTGGLQKTDVIIIAARPSMGKTAFAINMAINAAINFAKEAKTEQELYSVAFFSLEMSAEQITNRILSMQTGIDSSRIRMGNISKEEFAVLSRESVKLSELPVFIDDTPALSISALRTRARRLKRKHNLGLIVIDYLQLIRPSSSGSAYGNRVQEISEISQGIKALAKELDIPIIALSQLSRAVESREDKRPQLSDLRESGSIEQDADIVGFIYRAEYYLDRSISTDQEKHLAWQEELNQVRNLAEIIIAKHRNGPIGTFTLHFNGATTSFSNLARNI